MKLYFAASEPLQYQTLLKKNNVKSVLESAYSLNYNIVPNRSKFDDYLLDSGGYSARMHDIIIKVEDYAEYLNQHGIEVAFNLDTNNVEETIANQVYLEANTNAYIIPIYHYSDYMNKKYRNLLDQFLKYPYISVGGMAGSIITPQGRINFLNHTFNKTRNKIRVHGLGVTIKSLLLQYPWYSVDSTSWLSFAKFANSRCNSTKMTIVKAKKRHHLDNSTEEIKYWLEMEKNITKIWEKRGIIWSEFKK